MIKYEIDKDDLRHVQKALKGIEKGSETAIMRAVNNTAKKARKKLLEGVNKSYTVKAGGFNSRIKIRNATRSRLYAEITSKGRPLTLKRFKTSTRKDSGTKADVTKSGLKPLISTGGKAGIKASVRKVVDKFKGRKRASSNYQIKAFKAKGGLIMQRKTSDRYPVKVLRSVSAPKMLESVYKGSKNIKQELRPVVQETLHEEIQKEIDKLLNAQ